MTTRRRSPSQRPEPRRRQNTVRLPADVARRVADGHPWVFGDALRGRALPGQAGGTVDVVDHEGRFIGRALTDPKGNPVLRLFSATKGQLFDAGYLRGRVAAALALRRRLGFGAPDGCYRVLNGDSEGVPAVTVDSFSGYLVICCYSELVRAFQDPLLAALEQALAPPAVYLQRRYAPPDPGQRRPGGELVAGQPAPPEVTVREGRCRFAVDVTAPGSPGLFLDMRSGRELAASVAAGRRVLNCFSYTGAFSVAAAQAGARSVVSVDSSGRAHGRARRNFDENQLLGRASDLEFITGDTFAVLAQLAERGRRFDLAILDPPTFSSAKGRTFTALKDYAELTEAALNVLDPGGLLLACCNAAKLPAADLDRALGRGAARAGRRLVVTERRGLPADFPVLPAFVEGDYLKVFLARVE